MNMLRGSPQEWKKKRVIHGIEGPVWVPTPIRAPLQAGWVCSRRLIGLAWPAYTANTAYWGAFAPRA